MEKHIQFLNRSIKAIESDDINISEDNLEFHWYVPWNSILNYWFKSESMVIPQYEILYELIDRDDKTICKSVKPDFVVTKYSYGNSTFNEHIELIVEIKRSSNDLKKKFKAVSKQLENQISALFSNGGYEYIHGII